MLQKVCERIHNYFIYKTYYDTFQIEGGVISPSVPMLEGQRFLIDHSAMNDGVYTWHASGIKDDDDNEDVTLTDETFTGSVCALNVPGVIKRLVEQINANEEEYGEELNSPFDSENMGSYSYHKSSGASGEKNGAPWWETTYGGILDRWRRIAL